ncbi:beta-glucosidase [Flavobacteriaceae bacterium MAR_2010_188]|nr:beta-glucosidase [Flavobacteriaceae bacterium MAR_2010_188]
MKKGLKIILIVLGTVVGFVLIIALFSYLYFRANFLNFEDKYVENRNLKEIRANEYPYLDRNGNGSLDVYEDDRRDIEERVNDLLSLMRMEEKIHLLKGSGIASAMGDVDPEKGIPGVAGTIVPTPRLGLPTIYLSDGPAGLRIEPTRKNDNQTYYCTAFPIGTLLASTWNTELVQQVGEAMGNEAKEYGIDVILGPGANIHRHPLCGRNFEYFSEDPILTGKIGAAIVNGIESNGIGTSVKHFVANNQETDRLVNDAIVSERALHEIYFKGFEIIVKESQPWTIMSSYNKVNGVYTSESKELLTDILRDNWGFKGLVMSDWFGGNSAPDQIKAGNDLLEPGTNIQWKELIEAHEEGELSERTIDTSVKRILRLILQSQKMKNYDYSNKPDLKAHAKITRQSATEGMVLLKNDDSALPLNKNQNVALFGIRSYDFIAGGTGSGDVNEAYTISLEEGLKNVGLKINETAKKSFENHRVKKEDSFVKPEGMDAMFTPYNPPEMLTDQSTLEKTLQTADVAIITIGRNSGEGGDRVETDDFLLTKIEQELIERVCKSFHANGKKVIVVLNIGGVIETTSWKDKPDAILLAWQGGQEGGNSVADLLIGKLNPSGKLPMTFPVKLNDHASHANFPLDGKPFAMTQMFFKNPDKPEDEKVINQDYTKYEEGIYIGYRHFDKRNIEVSFPFGFGLSYTKFDYGEPSFNLSNDSINVVFKLKNTGLKSGKEVVQIYAEKENSTIDRAVRELKAFNKTQELQPEEEVEISLTFPVSDLRYWDEKKSDWNLEKGSYLIKIGASSRDIKQVFKVEL